MKLITELKILEADIRSLENSDNYTHEYLKQGSGCDSSDRQKERIEWIHKAMELPCVKSFVLEKAIELAKNNLSYQKDELKDYLS